MSIGGLTMDNDLSYRPWEISVEAVAALQKELSTTTEQLIAEKIVAAIAELPVPKDGIDIETVRQLIDEALLASTKISQQRKPGPKARWRMFVAAEACDFYLKHRRDPTAKELIELCHDKIKDLLPEGRVLDESSVYQLLRYLGAE